MLTTDSSSTIKIMLVMRVCVSEIKWAIIGEAHTSSMLSKKLVC